MLRLTSMIYPIVGTALAGGAVTAALVAGYTTGQGIIVAAGLGAVVGLPVSYLVARKLFAI